MQSSASEDSILSCIHSTTDRIGCQATVLLTVKTTRESLAGDWNAVGILERTRSDHDNVNKVPDSTSAQGDEF